VVDVADVRVVVHPEGVRELLADPATERYLLDVGRQVANVARVQAPKRSGAGAASIHAESFRAADGWEVRVSWDQEHYYMRFPDLGTRHLPARHFLENALDQYARF
jgi:HK97 gp10 family phage protein